MSCPLWNGEDAAERRQRNIGGFVMTNVSIAVLSAAEFRVARKLISELSAHSSYDDWLDCRYGTFMGCSLGGSNAKLVTVSLGPFLEWCDDRGLRPSESTLDAFASDSASREGAGQAVESSAASLRSVQLTERKPKSFFLSRGP